jgi:diacylglycerol O-acyltransferase
MDDASPDPFPRRLSPSDAIAWRIEKDPVLRSTMTLMMRLDTTPDHDRLRAKMRSAAVAFPRLRQRIVSPPLNVAAPVWAVDPYFDMAYHLRVVRAGDDGSEEWLLQFAASLAMRAFDRVRPLWECVVVEDLADGTSAMLFKVHHSLTDGIGGMLLLARIFDLDPDGTSLGGEAVDDAEPAPEHYDAVALLREAAAYNVHGAAAVATSLPDRAARVLRHPVAALGRLVRDGLSVARMLRPATDPLSPVMRDRSPCFHFDAFAVPLDRLKTAAHHVEHGTLNDAFLAAVARGLAHYHDAHGAPAHTLRVNMPVSTRRPDDTAAGGNAWAPMRFVVPIGTGDVAAQMSMLHELVVEEREEPSLGYVENVAGALNRLPTGVVTDVFGSMLESVDFVATNVPGAPLPLFVAGSAVTAMTAFAPPGGAAVNVGLLSYDGTAAIGVVTDPAAVPDPHLMTTCLRRGFDEVVAVAD